MKPISFLCKCNNRPGTVVAHNLEAECGDGIMSANFDTIQQQKWDIAELGGSKTHCVRAK